MAKSKSAVRSQMGSTVPSMTGSPAEYDRARAPFNQGHDLGGGGVPCKVLESIPHKAVGAITPTQTAGLDTRSPRPGTIQRKYGKSDS
jgi:hypothetical protein